MSEEYTQSTSTTTSSSVDISPIVKRMDYQNSIFAFQDVLIFAILVFFMMKYALRGFD